MNLSDLKKGDRVSFTHEYVGHALGSRKKNKGEGSFQEWLYKLNHNISDLNVPETHATVRLDNGGIIKVLPDDVKKVLSD